MSKDDKIHIFHDRMSLFKNIIVFRENLIIIIVSQQSNGL